MCQIIIKRANTLLVGRQGALSGNVQFAKGKFKNTKHALLVTPLVEMNNLWLNQLLINLDLRDIRQERHNRVYQ